MSDNNALACAVYLHVIDELLYPERCNTIIAVIYVASVFWFCATFSYEKTLQYKHVAVISFSDNCVLN